MSSRYVTGGTMQVNETTYVVRDADTVLTDNLLHGQFCYVLTPRQMGKSSLMVRTADKLRERGVTTVILDLSSQGYSLGPAEWYRGLIEMAAEQLDVEEEASAFIGGNTTSSPLQLWHKWIRSFLLHHTQGPVVLFLDEIDIIRRMDFETDEFFASIRSCFNRRSEDATYRRLTVCLMGVATPADLITDARITPFNIGTRIELRDFSKREASELRYWLGKGDGINSLLMDRVYYWTNGHPYLTQRLCEAVAMDDTITTQADIDKCCRSMYSDSKIGAFDDNLSFVRNWMLEGNEEQRNQVLALYKKVLAGRRVKDSEADANVAKLKLCGIVQSTNGILVPRNQIYRTAFDKCWITDNTPVQELLRQRRAYIIGALRVVIPSVIIISLVVALSIAAVINAMRATAAEEITKRMLYDADMYQAGAAWFEGNTSQAKRLVENHANEQHEFAWNYLNTMLNTDLHRYNANRTVFHVACSKDGQLLAAGTLDGAIHILSANTLKPVTVIPGGSAVMWVDFSADGSLIAAAYSEGRVRVWSVREQRLVGSFATGVHDADSGATCVAFSPADSNLLVACDECGGVWKSYGDFNKAVEIRLSRSDQTATGKKEERFGIHGIAFSPEGNEFTVSGALDKGTKLIGLVIVYDTRSWITHLSRSFPGRGIVSPSYSPDGRSIAITDGTGEVSLLDSTSLSLLHAFNQRFVSMGDGVQFSHNGKLVAASGWDNTIRIWDTRDYSLVDEIHGCTGPTTSVAFLPGDEMLVSGDGGHFVKSWKVQDVRRNSSLPLDKTEVRAIAISPTEPLVAVCSDRFITFWDTTAQKKRCEFRHKLSIPGELQFSPDGKRLFCNGQSGAVKQFDASDSSKNLQSFQTPRNRVCAFAISRDGQRIAALCADLNQHNGLVIVWSIKSQLEISRTPLPGVGTGCITFSPDGTKLAIAEDIMSPGKPTLEVYDVALSKRLATFEHLHTNVITSVAWSPDGDTIASTCWDRSIYLWDAHTYKPFQRLPDSRGFLKTCCFTPDSRYLLTAGEDKKIVYWDIALARKGPAFVRMILSLGVHETNDRDADYIHSMAISGDSRLVVSHDRNSVRLWRAEPPSNLAPGQ